MKPTATPPLCLSDGAGGFLILHRHFVINSSPNGGAPQSSRSMRLKPQSSRSPGLSISGKCQKCKGQGAIECPGCKGTGKNKKNGNIFERWKCFECQGFGLKSCSVCGKGGLTPEQRGER